MILPTQRHLFDLPDDVTWINCAYMSPQLHAVSEVGKESVIRKSRPWLLKPEDFFTDSEALRKLFARLVDAEVSRIIRESHQQAMELLRKHRRQLDALVEALLARETLDEKEILEVTGLPPAPALENARVAAAAR